LRIIYSKIMKDRYKNRSKNIQCFLTKVVKINLIPKILSYLLLIIKLNILYLGTQVNLKDLFLKLISRNKINQMALMYLIIINDLEPLLQTRVFLIQVTILLIKIYNSITLQPKLITL
jgi:hypothetical protein